MNNEEIVKAKKRLPLIINIFKNIKNKNDEIIISAYCLVKVLGDENYNINDIYIEIDDKKYNIEFKLKKSIWFIKGYRINKYVLKLPIKEIINNDIQNKITVRYKDFDPGRVIYSAFDFFKGKNRNSKIIMYKNKSIYLRQTKKNTMYLTVRDTNKYDYGKAKLKIALGRLLSFFWFKKDLILLYEKDTSKYEESASVLYEKLIDMGYNNCYFILNRDNIKLQSMDDKYKKNIVYKDSLKHIIYFFKCKKFLSTESIDHSLQLRVANKYVMDKYKNHKNEYVFLQHGVMYMVSLDSDLRTGFKKQAFKLHKIVTSSELEAKHFIDKADFNRDDLYICGLPKFDRAIRNEGADKIVIMPTWRRWEANEASINYKNTKYYKLIKRIVDAIPPQLQDKVIVLPHPLMLKEIKSNKDYQKYIPKGEIIYDDILKNCKLLITDYSSISYDAFYRGCNVIFYWEEKDECMKKYGSEAKLMLNDKNAFGDICYNISDLKRVIKLNYEEEQNSKHIRKYRKIVEFNDNKNTERLINMLIKDGIIKKRKK